MTRLKCAILYVTPSDADYRLFQTVMGDDDRIKVSRASSAEEALDKIQGSPNSQPNLVITSWRLPNMPAIEFLRNLKGDSVSRAIPVVVFTTALHPEDLLEAYDAGVSAVITKPVDLDGTMVTLSTLKNLWVNYAQLPDCTDVLRREGSSLAGLRAI
jgi:two-component system response regulator RpfG